MRRLSPAAVVLVAAFVPRLAADGPALSLAGHTSEVYTVTFSPDGASLASAGNREVKVWDAATGKERFTFAIKGTNVFGLAFSPDGRRLAVGVSKQVKVLDAATGQEVFSLAGAGQFLFRLVFSPDGRCLAAASGTNGQNTPGEVCVWESDTGRLIRSLRGHAEPVLNVAYARDGRLLAGAGGAASGSRPGEVKLWEAGTGREVGSLRGHADNVYGVAFSPDGRHVASCGGVKGSAKVGDVKLWEVATGQAVLSLAAHPGAVFGIAYGPGGRWLATAGGDGAVKVWDAATGGELLGLPAHAGAVFSLSVSPDGRTLASGGQDKVVKVWSLAGHIPAASPGMAAATGRELEALWADLSGPDAVKAYRATWKLAAAPERSVPFLCSRLRPVAGLTPRQRERAAVWVRDLDHDRFRVREAATRGLAGFGEAVIAVLRQSLADAPPPEARRRAEQLLEVLTEPALSAGRLAELRGLEVLEHAGTPEARALLERLASGLPDARLTRDAEASLGRLGHRPVAP
jgi:DNA-binding beta-propeller fold protein YncE